MENNARFILEYDFYGGLLTERKREVVKMYHEENLTLQEIGEELGISRQSAHDRLKSAEKKLSEYEEKLGLVARFEKTGRCISRIDKLIETMVSENKENKELTLRLGEIKAIIDDME